MDFNEKRKSQSGIKSLGDLQRAGKISGRIDPEKFVHGPEKIDCLARPWHRGDLTGILAGAGVGKCLAKDTPVLMYDGSIKPVQEITVGEQLMGPDSKPREVLSLATGRQEMYRIIGTDESSYVVNKSHILSLKYSLTESRFGYSKGDICNISVEEYLNKSSKFKACFKGYRVGVEFDTKETNFDPYLMGLWLGDGTKNKPQISNPDKEVIEYLNDYVGKSLGYKVSNVARSTPDKCQMWDITTPRGSSNLFLNEIRSFINEGNEKFINNDYLINSRHNRLKLLAGIIDTDGSLSNNCYDIIIKDNAFADDFEYLCRSLGFKVSRCIKVGKIKELNFEANYHRFTVSGDILQIPCKIARKQGQPRNQIKEPLNYGITVEPIGEGDYYGFVIDGDHLFLLGDFVVTHNTSFVLYNFKHILMNNPEGVVVFVSLEMTASEIAEKWFKATEDVPEIADRFYIVENYDEEGKSRDLTAAQIKYEVRKIKETLGVIVHAVAVDHIHEINIGNSVDYNPVCKELKNMAVELDTHGFILSQTTKGKGLGDVPVPKDGCFGTSRYEWLMTNIITIFQPLKRVQKECSLPVLAWQYCKIRYKNAKDKVKEDMNYLLKFNFETEDLEELDRNDKSDFGLYYEKVQELRQNEEKFKSFQFDLSEVIKGENGKTVRIDRIVGGTRPQSLEDEL